MKILYVVHAGFWEEFSGTPLVSKQYIEIARKKGWEVAIIKPEIPVYKNPNAGTSQTPQDIKVWGWKNQANWALEAFQAPPDSALIPHEFRNFFQPDIVHIIDWVGMDSSILPALKQFNVPIVRHFCNFEDVCAFNEPTRYFPDGSACAAPIAERQCAECLLRREKIEINSYNGTLTELKNQLEDLEKNYLGAISKKVKNKWLAFDQHLHFYDHLIFPSNGFGEYFFSHNKTGKPFSIIGHGIQAGPQRTEKRSGGTLNCVFLNGASELKGWHHVENAFDELLTAGNPNIRLRAYGNSDLARTSRLSKFREVEFLAPFNPSEIAQVLGWADVGIIASNFETYSRAVREFILYGVVPIGTSAFGILDIVNHRKNGMLLEKPYAGGLVKALNELQHNPELLASLRKGVGETKIISPDEEFDEIEKLYVKLIAARRNRLPPG